MDPIFTKKKKKLSRIGFNMQMLNKLIIHHCHLIIE